jgi:tungstate transport system substrate-binding protein
MPLRRRLLIAVPCLAAGWSAGARPARVDDPLRLGVDRSLMESGLAPALVRAFGLETGIGVKTVAGPARPLLDALERGELDAALTNAPDAEGRLVEQGFAHDRQPVAAGEFVLVGPVAPGKPKALDPAGLAGQHDAAAALAQLQRAALALPGTVTFLSAGDGSGLHLAEQALWRRAGIAPAAPWYAVADAAAALIPQARARGAYALVERASWAAHGGAPLTILLSGDPLLAEPVHVMRSFRSRHAAAKLFGAWVAGPRGQRVVAAQKYQGKVRAA